MNILISRTDNKQLEADSNFSILVQVISRTGDCSHEMHFIDEDGNFVLNNSIKAAHLLIKNPSHEVIRFIVTSCCLNFRVVEHEDLSTESDMTFEQIISQPFCENYFQQESIRNCF